MKMSGKQSMPRYRIGIGFDMHRFISESKGKKKLVLGQVRFNFKGLEGASSDVDVLLHSISDAILGAAGEPDIGTLFPPAKSKGISSKEILINAKKLVEKKGYSIENIDCVIVAQKPKIGNKIPLMKRKIKEIIGCNINIKVKSPEGIGALGKAEGISAMSIALLCKNSQQKNT